MNNRAKIVHIALAVMLAGANLSLAGSYSSAFEQYLTDQNSSMVTAIVTMTDQVDLEALQNQLYSIHADRRLWHETVVRALREKASATQGNLLVELEYLKENGEVESYYALWIANIIIVKASADALDQIVSRTDVAQISPDYEIKLDMPISKSNDLPSITSVEEALTVINADQCWNIGITGRGRLISSIETGVDGHHPAIADAWAGLDSQYTGHPEWAWFDPETHTTFPQDWGTHGTFMTGVMCGHSGTDTIGVAIDAHWVSCGVVDRIDIIHTVQDALLSFQWNADPDGDPSTVWDVPDVCCCPWGFAEQHGYPPCDELFWPVIDGMEAAGVVAIFSAGGMGPGPNTIVRPADRAANPVSSFCVGAIDNTNSNYPVTSFSSRGPSYCTPDGSADFKPEVTGPGINIRSSVPGNSYAIWSGTASATSFVAGVVALIRQANPDLSSDQVKQILLETAVDLGTTGDDNSYGMGLVDAYAAVLRAQAILDSWGTLVGVVTDQASGLPIQDAHISIVGRPWWVNSHDDGSYALIVPADTAWVVMVEHPPLYLPMFDTITVVENDTLIQNYALEGKVTVTLRASFGNPVDASYRSFYLKGSWDSDGFWNSGWIAPAIEIKDDGIAPDQTANDGVFTGQALLTRDLAHTYQWAIYSENYGGDASRLQNGANFTIPTLVPPTVAALSVNPSGSDHNWDVSVYANGGSLILDMVRGFDGNPTKWGGAVALDSGVAYSVRFRVMHSVVASYGAGGAGGANIFYMPPFDGSYEFIFNDRDDSYVIQLTGTGAPVGLTAVGNLDSHVLLRWFPPGTVESHEIIIDDGQTALSRYFNNYNDLMGTKFETENGITLDSVILHVLTEGDPYWPWPDNSHDPIAISVFMDDGTGYPEPDPAYYTETTDNPGEWIRVGVPHLATTNNFWVVWNNLEGGGDEAICLDNDTDYPQRKWARINGVWTLFDDTPGDFMIRVKEFGEIEPGWGPYHVYRDTIPQPFNRQRRITPYVIFSPGEFDDWGEDIYGPIINGVTYYYQVSAVYDLGGGQYIEVGPSNQAIATPMEHSCRYVPGDINSDSTFSGLDVSFMVSYFKGGARPTYICDCPPDSNWYVAGDVNGNCRFNGIDVTYAVAYFKGGPAPVPCPDCPPEP